MLGWFAALVGNDALGRRLTGDFAGHSTNRLAGVEFAALFRGTHEIRIRNKAILSATELRVERDGGLIRFAVFLIESLSESKINL